MDANDFSGLAQVANCLVSSNAYFVFAVSGTPATALGDAIKSAFNQQTNFSFEWSVNEKVAMESAIGVSAAGKRSAIVLKQCGMHTALDPLANAVAHGIGNGIVVFVGDDSSANSSTLLLDSRLICELAHLPCLEISSKSDIFKTIAKAYELSEQAAIPVVVRFLADLVENKRRISDRSSHTLVSSKSIDHIRSQQLTKLGRYQYIQRFTKPIVQNYIDSMEFTFESHCNDCQAGIIIVGGVSTHLDIPDDLCQIRTEVSVPIPERVKQFAHKHKRSLVIEEPLAFLEKSLIRIAIPNSVHGKLDGYLVEQGPISQSDFETAVRSLVSPHEPAHDIVRSIERKTFVEKPATHPYHDLFSAISDLAGEGTFVSVDVGSSVKLCYPPYNASSIALCLGSPISVIGGYARAERRAGIAVIGDYGLMHSGLESLIELKFRSLPGVIILLANGVSAHTGGQDTVLTPDSVDSIKIENLIRAIGVSNIQRWRLEQFSTEQHRIRLKEMLDSNQLCCAIVESGKGVKH